MSYMPPELAQEPMEMTHRGSIICSYRRWMTGAILIKTVPAMTMRSASRGVPRITSAPNREISYLLVMLVAISTKQQERPKLNGQTEFLRLHATRSSTRDRMRVRWTASSRFPSAFSACGEAAGRLIDQRMAQHPVANSLSVCFPVSNQEHPPATNWQVSRAVC